MTKRGGGKKLGTKRRCGPVAAAAASTAKEEEEEVVVDAAEVSPRPSDGREEKCRVGAPEVLCCWDLTAEGSCTHMKGPVDGGSLEPSLSSRPIVDTRCEGR